MKYALTAGNNYTGTQNELSFCVADSIKTKKEYGLLNIDEIIQLLDLKATKQGFVNALNHIGSQVVSGDIIAVHDSGHGTTFMDSTEADRIGEALYFPDGIFTDREYIEFVNSLPKGVKSVFLFDTCFSGGMASKPFGVKAKYIHTDDRIPFGYKAPRSLFKIIINEDHICHTGCGENEYSYDASELKNGAFTYYYWKSFHEVNKTPYNIQAKLSGNYGYLPNMNYPQTPQLICNEKWLNEPEYENTWNEEPTGTEDHQIPNTEPQPEPVHNWKKNFFVQLFISIINFFKNLFGCKTK